MAWADKGRVQPSNARPIRDGSRTLFLDSGPSSSGSHLLSLALVPLGCPFSAVIQSMGAKPSRHAGDRQPTRTLPLRYARTVHELPWRQWHGHVQSMLLPAAMIPVFPLDPRACHVPVTGRSPFSFLFPCPMSQLLSLRLAAVGRKTWTMEEKPPRGLAVPIEVWAALGRHQRARSGSSVIFGLLAPPQNRRIHHRHRLVPTKDGGARGLPEGARYGRTTTAFSRDETDDGIQDRTPACVKGIDTRWHPPSVDRTVIIITTSVGRDPRRPHDSTVPYLNLQPPPSAMGKWRPRQVLSAPTDGSRPSFERG